MEYNFDCTICGKCCYGQVPLTIKDALTHAERFPLAIIWTPVGPDNKYFNHTARLGPVVNLSKSKEIGVRITPAAYIPPTLPCPELADDNRCKIHLHKPARCKSMPFSPYREESQQADLLIPRENWECDISEEAPVVYRDNKIVERQEFDQEFNDLIDQVETLRRYADWLLASVPTLMKELNKVARKKGGGQVIVSFFSLLPRLPKVDVAEFAAQQLPIVKDFINKSNGVSGGQNYNKHYREYAVELERVLNQ
ncbi:MAG: YkgJ family cysteine cluster protein [Rhodospirillaceae bacterium]|jgi:Fe-S-cluster containining protein|nr:YkgJ family cysteine cluster protein [Rhodospirillaceae bacterium]MBT7957125.1 YkgJ family cysteine cluster protein [Rhodospirillaceae bacterium]